MNRPFIVGITGGIGTGKTIVTEIFRLLGVPVYNADNQAKWLMTNNPALMQAIKDRFGSDSYQSGQLDRQYLAARVFGNATETEKLNKLVHPVVADDFKDWHSNQKATYVLKEAALLFETGSYKELDFTILVSAPEQLRIKRIIKRDPQRPVDQIRDIISRQLPVEKARPLADAELINDEKNMVIPQVIALDKQIKKEATS